MNDAELVADAIERHVAERDPRVIREARELAVGILGPHANGGYRTCGSSRVRDAIHESGHAVCALHVGATFERVQIRPRALLVGPRYPSDDARLDGALSGGLAELHYFGDIVDEGTLADMKRALRVSLGDRVALRAAAERVDGLFQHRNAALRALASALLDAGELRFNECRSIVRAMSTMIAALALAALALLGCGGSQFEVNVFPDAGAPVQRDPKPDNVPEAGATAAHDPPASPDAAPEASSVADPPDAGATTVIDAGAPDAPVASSCNATTCREGCCDSAGVCRFEDNACGIGGALCSDCSAIGYYCGAGGVCMPKNYCDPAACPSCPAGVQCCSSAGACGCGINLGTDAGLCVANTLQGDH